MWARSLPTYNGGDDAMNDVAMSPVMQLVARRISEEVQASFPDMGAYRLLQTTGQCLGHSDTSILSSVNTRRGTSSTSAGIPCRKRRRSNATQTLEDYLAFSRLHDGKCAKDTERIVTKQKDRHKSCCFSMGRKVSCNRCDTQILSCRSCTVLSDYVVVMAISTIHGDVTVLSDGSECNFHDDSSVASHRLRSLVNPPSCDDSCTTSPFAVSFGTVHLIHRRALDCACPIALSLQSLFRPGCPTKLESYPRHMVHFGLLCHALWQAQRENWKEFTVAKGGITQEEREGVSLIPSTAEDAVLVLGLGGNVIGQCLDTVLLPVVPVDVVEVEPAILHVCRCHDRVPPLTDFSPLWPPLVTSGKMEGTPDAPATGASDRADDCLVATASSSCARGGHYRFILGDAYRFLFLSSSHGGLLYRLIFLDCYDPVKESMMHEGDLLQLCMARLQPGGCLIVNAHIVPQWASLKDSFLSRGFASVQVLRVSGYDQCVVCCLKKKFHDEVPDTTSHGESRFTVPCAQQMASYLNAWNNTDSFLHNFSVDGDWLLRSQSLYDARRAAVDGTGHQVTVCRLWHHTTWEG